jgi:formylglycine-generating enzyme
MKGIIMKSVWRLMALVLLCVCIPAVADVLNMPAGTKSLEMVVVGNPGNPADDTGFGAVANPFRIGKFEVTAAQYVEFLNAKAKTDPHGLYHLHMDEGVHIGCKIQRSGAEGSYTYGVPVEYANRPVNWVSFWSACRFANWLHNGQGDGDTETGAYMLNGYKGSDGRAIKRIPGAKWFVPSEDEWYKAAYYDPEKSGGAGYWNYPTRSDSQPSRDFKAVNAANYYDDSYLDPTYYLTEVGAFFNSPSGYGTFDQGGNVGEWNEAIRPPFFRSFRGGSFGNDGGHNVIDESIPQKGSQFAGDIVGFRVAGALPQADDGSTAKSAGVDFPRRPWRNPENGKPFFPMGWFTWESDQADLDEMAREGANFVLFVNTPSDVDDDALLQASLRNMAPYLDHAHKRGIKVLAHVGSWFNAFMRNDTDAIARQRQWVETFSKHPALLGYELYDEPEYRNGGMKNREIKENKSFRDALVRMRNAIREWDSNRNHTVQVAFNVVPYEGQNISDWRFFLPAIDGFQVDRYPCGSGSPYFQQGDWCTLIMAWTMAHGVAEITKTSHLNPAPIMQGIGLDFYENGNWWRDPLYEETRYMAYSSLTAGSWGVIHFIRNPSSASVRRNVARLHAELRQLIPAFENSWEKPPFTVSHNHEEITRDFITDCISDISTLTLEDEKNYYLIVSDNSGVFEDVSLRLKLPNIKDTKTREASVLNEDWSREIKYDSKTGEWVITTHKMCFGDINVWVIPKAAQ